MHARAVWPLQNCNGLTGVLPATGYFSFTPIVLHINREIKFINHFER